eukprot:scaffold2560_cov397-Prasinococcus_capsulatus_cf.AAC.15
MNIAKCLCDIVGSEACRLHHAQVRLVAPKAAHCSIICHSREGRVDIQAQGFMPHPAHKLLNHIHDVFSCRERHLQIYLRELRLAIGTTKLVSIASSDLKVAFYPSSHQELLMLLRTLRQGIELALLRTAWHQELSSALGS